VAANVHQVVRLRKTGLNIFIFDYSGYGQSTGGPPREKVLFDERIFRPLDMVDTFKESVTNPPSDAATPFNPRFAAKPTYGLIHCPNSIIHATRAPTGSCPARPTWCASPWRFNRGKLLRPDTVQILQTPQRLTSGELTSYGRWRVMRSRPPATMASVGLKKCRPFLRSPNADWPWR
jgi:hypothetical protein